MQYIIFLTCCFVGGHLIGYIDVTDGAQPFHAFAAIALLCGGSFYSGYKIRR